MIARRLTVAVTVEDHDNVRIAFLEQVDRYVPRMDGPSPAYWAGELWSIDRTLRALNIRD